MTVQPVSIKVFSTSPQSSAVSRSEYLGNIIQVARWSEQYGCQGILVYTDNGLVDPWLVAQVIVQNTTHLCPLVAVQPVYMHPYTVAKMVSSLGHLYNRRVYLNMVAGGFKNDLLALNDNTPHDHRYARLTEYTHVIKQLLTTTTPVTFQGEFYTITNLKLKPELPRELQPAIFVSGSSESGMACARAVGATAVQYPQPPGQCTQVVEQDGCNYGIRVGIIARETTELAWSVAHDRFPADRKGELAHQLAMKTSDSLWHRRLCGTAQNTRAAESVYWMLPFETYKTFCPYLVGSYAEVAEEVGRYLELGYRNIILDIPPTEEELQHIRTVLDYASAKCQFEPADVVARHKEAADATFSAATSNRAGSRGSI